MSIDNMQRGCIEKQQLVVIVPWHTPGIPAFIGGDALLMV